MNKEFYTLQDVMDILQISKRQARALFHSDDFIGAFKLGNSFRISAADFDTWLQKTKETGGYNIQSYKV